MIVPSSLFYPDRKFQLIPGMDNMGMQIVKGKDGDCKGCRRKGVRFDEGKGFDFEFVGKEVGDG